MRCFAVPLLLICCMCATAQEAWRGVHPRLFLTESRIRQLKAATTTTHAEIWGFVKRQAESIAAGRPPAYQYNASEPNEFQNWQRDVGNNLPYLAMAWLMTGEHRYLESAQEWSLASCGYPHWGVGRSEGNDLAAGHQLFGLSIVYDWLYHDLDPAARRTIRRTLLERAAVMYRAAGTQYWRNEFLQNHLWVNVGGLAAVGFALFDDEEAATQASSWIALAREKFRPSEAALGPDGASHEGVSYWGYGVEYMLKYWQMAGDLLDENLWSQWWRHTSYYRLYMGLPRDAWTRSNNIVDIGDSPRWGGYGPEYSLRRLARLYRDPHAQWLARELARTDITAPRAAWLNLVWYDPDVPAAPPDRLPTLRHFEDLGIVSSRSDWSGKESLLVFKCGPALGHQATRKFDYDSGAGHAHPDANHFVLFGKGEWLIRDDGYQWKMTDQHNTLVVDGKGQLGEGRQWFRGKEQLGPQKVLPTVVRAESTPAMDHVIGDAAPTYPRECGLRRFVRHLLFLKPDVLIVADEIETDEPRDLELRFHPEYKAVTGDDGAYLCRGQRAVLRLDPLTVQDVRVSEGDLPAKDRDGKPASLYTIRLQKKGLQWRNAVALSWCAAANRPVRVRLERREDRWLFDAGLRAVALDWRTPAVERIR